MIEEEKKPRRHMTPEQRVAERQGEIARIKADQVDKAVRHFDNAFGEIVKAAAILTFLDLTAEMSEARAIATKVTGLGSRVVDRARELGASIRSKPKDEPAGE